ncbi:MAG: tetratricopeptide repeat protein [Bryobacteraceae bacterium]
MRRALTLAIFTAAAAWGQPAAPDPAVLSSRFAAARQAESEQNYEKAAGEYQQMLKLYPDAIPEIYQNLGIVYYLQRRYEEAIATFRDGIRRKRLMQGAQLFLGISLLATGQAGQAVTHLKVAHQLRATPETRNYLAAAFLQTSDLSRALPVLRSQLEYPHERQVALYRLGEVYLRMANEDVKVLTDQTPDLKFGHVLAGRIFEMQEFYQLAAKEYTQAARLDAGNASVFLSLARLLLILGEERPAEIALERYRMLVPEDRAATINRTHLPKGELADVGVPVAYEKELQSLPAIDPADARLPLHEAEVRRAARALVRTDPSGLGKKALEAFEQKRWPEAVRLLERLGRVSGQWIVPYLRARANVLGEDYLAAWKTSEAHLARWLSVPSVRMLHWEIVQQLGLQSFDQLLREFPDSAHAHFVKARSLNIRGKREALDEFKAAISADPTQPELRISLADYYLANSQYNEALAACEEELKLDPYSAAARARIGRIYVELRRPEDAIPRLLEVLKKNPGDAETRAELARGYELRGDPAKSLEEYLVALKQDPSLTRLHYVISRLYRRLGQPEQARWHIARFQESEQSQRRQLRERVERFQKGKAMSPAPDREE